MALYLPDKCSYIRTKEYEWFGLTDKICKIYIKGHNEFIFIKCVKETATGFSGVRLQQDKYNDKKFYLTDEKNKWHGLISDGALGKGRSIYVYNYE
jgi:hypothetical protein